MMWWYIHSTFIVPHYIHSHSVVQPVWSFYICCCSIHSFCCSFSLLLCRLLMFYLYDDVVVCCPLIHLPTSVFCYSYHSVVILFICQWNRLVSCCCSVLILFLCIVIHLLSAFSGILFIFIVLSDLFCILHFMICIVLFIHFSFSLIQWCILYSFIPVCICSCWLFWKCLFISRYGDRAVSMYDAIDCCCCFRPKIHSTHTLPVHFYGIPWCSLFWYISHSFYIPISVLDFILIWRHLLHSVLLTFVPSLSTLYHHSVHFPFHDLILKSCILEILEMTDILLWHYSILFYWLLTDY